MNSAKYVRAFAIIGMIALTAPAPAATFVASMLDETGFAEVHGSDVSGTTSVGVGMVANSGPHAVLWNGSGSPVDLNPPDVQSSWASGVSGTTQVGTYEGYGGFYQHAVLWNGTAASAVDLHPGGGFVNSSAFRASGEYQFGNAWNIETTHAILWHGTAASAVDLTPPNFRITNAGGLSGGYQVGYGEGFATGGQGHALLWSDTAASVVDLNPAGFTSSNAKGVWGTNQVGNGSGPNTGGEYHALLWSGTAASWVDLHPAGGFTASDALGIFGTNQIGLARGPVTDGKNHAFWWNGTAASAVDLHPLLSGLGPTFIESIASGISENGQIIGTAYDSTGKAHAVLWTPVPEPASCALICCGFIFVSQLRCRFDRPRLA